MGGVGPFAVDCVGSGHLDWLRLVVVGAKAERTPICFAPFLLVGALVVPLSGDRISIWLASVFAP